MRSLTGFLSRWRLLQCLCLVLVSSIILSNTSIESKASETEWKTGSFKIHFSGSNETYKAYNGSNSNFDGVGRQIFDSEEYTFSDVHFIEGNEYVLDTSSFDFLVSENSFLNLLGAQNGTVSRVELRREPNVSFKNGGTITYGGMMETVFNSLRFYMLISGKSSYKNAVGYQLGAVVTYDFTIEVTFKYQGEMDNEKPPEPEVPDVPDTPDVPSSGNNTTDADLIEGWTDLGAYKTGYWLHLFGHNVSGSSDISPTFKFGPSGSAVVQQTEQGQLVLESGGLVGTYEGDTSEIGEYSGNTNGSGFYEGNSTLEGSYSGDTSSQTTLNIPFGGLVNEFKEPSSITDFAGSFHGDVNISGSENGQIELESDEEGDITVNGYEQGSSSSTGTESGTMSVDLSGVNGGYSGTMQNKVVYTYDVDIPVILDFGDDCRKTFDGELRVPLAIKLNVGDYHLVGSEIEMYDSTGQRINATVKTSTRRFDGLAETFGVSLDMRFDKRFIDKRIYGTLRLHVAREFATDGAEESSALLDVAAAHDDLNFWFIDWCDVKVFDGDVSQLEVVEYQKAGHYVTNEDGSITWVDGETVTEYVGDKQAVEQTEQAKAQTGILKNIFSKITDFFGSFFQNLIDTMIGLVVPSSEEMQSLLNELMTFFSDKFGFLFYPFELLAQAVQIFTQDGSTALTFPSFSIMGYEVWPDLTYDLTENEIANTVFTYVRYATGAMLAMAFINYLRNFFDKRFGGGGN